MEQPAAMPAQQLGHTKQYVFVNEYNRHKRLKVMRACDGCRKRKIRCDGALQNGPWPCGSCVRLKLKCIPPTLDQEDDQQTADTTAPPGQGSFQISSAPLNNKSAADASPTFLEWATTSSPNSYDTTQTSSADFSPSDYASRYYQYNSLPLDQGLTESDYAYRPESSVGTSSSGDPQEVSDTLKELSNQMGDLSIDSIAVAPYIKRLDHSDLPSIDEDEMMLPTSVNNQSNVQIPREMMPLDERVLDYFGYFFNYIHPYVPVLNKKAFYVQWHTSRHSISPLLLEAIFACVARYLEPPVEAKRWLALASKHEEAFRDVPRLSTIQALVILTKAREFAPKRGYYYQSWMSVKHMATMAIDLGLHEHFDQHRGTVTCTLSSSDCSMRTRIWQVVFILEMMIGGPQGRKDFSVDLEAIDFGLPPQAPDMDSFEHHTSRRLTHFARAAAIIKQALNNMFALRRMKPVDWALDPALARNNESLPPWFSNLPPDMQIHYDDKSNPPLLGARGGDHFLGHMHSYCHLVVIMNHRPQLQALLEKNDPNFKMHLELCNESASKICRLQEALLRDFGLHGLTFMNRGIGFTIYCVLTCTMLHLATITSPDPVANSNARMYFTRHMRVLEHCTTFATPEMQLQIKALRDAFSHDTNKEFELKPGLGLRSPSMSSQPTPPEMKSLSHDLLVQQAPIWSQSQNGSLPVSGETRPSGHLITSRTPAMHYTSPTDFTDPHSLDLTEANLRQITSAPQSSYTLDALTNSDQVQPRWDPSGIFQQWNNAFETPVQTPPSQHMPPMSAARMPATSAPVIPQVQPVASPAIYNNAPNMPPHNAVTNSGLSGNMPAVPAVTPGMWQSVFTDAYVSGHGQKRYREEESVNPHTYQQFMKRRG